LAARTKSSRAVSRRKKTPASEGKGEWVYVPGGLAGPTHTKRRVLDDGTTIETWDDPKWTSALRELRAGKPDKLADLMRAERTAPPDIAEAIGIMLAPPEGYRGARLVVQVPKRWTLKNLADVEKHAVHLELMEARKTYKKKEATISAVAATRKAAGLPYSVGYLRKCWKVDRKELVLRSQRLLGRAAGSR
jgi:hypothetical protein